MKAMIFAAGMGTRLKPITDRMPKALVPVCGKPLIEHISLKLKSSGFDSAVVNVHHFAEMVENWCAAQDWMDFSISDERHRLLETGGAVLHARKLLDGNGGFLIHNVDILTNADLGKFCSLHKMDSIATLLVSDRKTSRYLLFDKNTMQLCGWTNDKTAEVIMVKDISPEDCLKRGFSGIHFLSDSVFPLMEEYVRVKGLEEDGGFRFPILDFYLYAAASHPIVGIDVKDFRMLDVGKLDTLEMAEEFISSHSSLAYP